MAWHGLASHGLARVKVGHHLARVGHLWPWRIVFLHRLRVLKVMAQASDEGFCMGWPHRCLHMLVFLKPGAWFEGCAQADVWHRMVMIFLV